MNEKPLNQKHVSKPLTGSVRLQYELQLNTKLNSVRIHCVAADLESLLLLSDGAAVHGSEGPR